MAGDESRKPISLKSLAIGDLANVLARVGFPEITEETLRDHVEAGAPLNDDGTLNLIHYAAWLVREVAHGD